MSVRLSVTSVSIYQERPGRLFEEFRAFRSSSDLCDVEICTEDGNSIIAHRLILAAFSPYFKGMFICSMKEKYNFSISLKGIQMSGLRPIINYMYTCELLVNEENIEEIICAANLLRMVDIEKACCTFIMERINPSNCLGVVALSSALSLHNLYGFAWNFTLKNFSDVVKEEEFLSLPPSDIKTLLSSENINSQNEKEVYQTLMNWIQFDPTERSEYIEVLFPCVRLCMIPSDYITNNIASNALIMDSKTCQDLVKNAVKFINAATSEKAKYSGTVNTVGPRLAETLSDHLLVVGGLTPSLPTDHVEKFYPKKKQWLEDIFLQSPRCGCRVANLYGSVYCMGGFDSLHLTSCECLEPDSKSWIPKGDLNVPRTYHGACTTYGKIYVIGGSVGTKKLSSVECYCPEKNQWKQVKSAPLPLLFSGVTSLSGLVYSVGGHNGKSRLNLVHCYDPHMDLWSEVASLEKPKSIVGATSFEGRIYCIGGFNGDEYLDEVEAIDPREGKWVKLKPLNLRRSAAGACVLHNELYCIGGFNGTFLESSEIYDSRRNEWMVSADINVPRAHFGVVAI